MNLFSAATIFALLEIGTEHWRVMSRRYNAAMSSTKVSIDMDVRVQREGRTWVASCEVLRLASQGKTRAAALASFEEAAKLNFDVLAERGTLAKVIAIASREGRVHVREAATELVTMPVPMEMMAARHAA